MPDGTATALDARLYRAALRLCPGPFRREHGDEMACDFDDACREGAALAGRALWTVRFHLSVDLARTIAVQWLRTGLPAIGCAALSISLALTIGFAAMTQVVTARIRSHPVHSEPVAVVLLVAVVVLVIVTTIVFNLWVHRPRRVGRK
jgi:hypothetical protein